MTQSSPQWGNTSALPRNHTSGRSPWQISTEAELAVRRDLQFAFFLERFLLARSFEALAAEQNKCPNTLRRAYRLESRGHGITPEEFRSIHVARQQQLLLAPLRPQYTRAAIARRHSVSYGAVRRVHRDLLSNKPVRGTSPSES